MLLDFAMAAVRLPSDSDEAKKAAEANDMVSNVVNTAFDAVSAPPAPQ
jgi:hypothetical protein